MLFAHAADAAVRNRPQPASEDAAKEFLAFTIGREEYGLDILKVQEHRSDEAVTRLANAPVPDMRIEFNLGSPSYDAWTVVLNLGGKVVAWLLTVLSTSPRSRRTGLARRRTWVACSPATTRLGQSGVLLA